MTSPHGVRVLFGVALVVTLTDFRLHRRIAAAPAFLKTYQASDGETSRNYAHFLEYQKAES